METYDLRSFLASAKATLPKAIKLPGAEKHVIMGNEAADLDSVVSAIVLAYHTAISCVKKGKENELNGEKNFVFPVVNCHRIDLPLRSEVMYVFKKHGIDVKNLICKDEIDLMSLKSAGNLKVSLVDHNMIASEESYLQPCIAQIIDHHKCNRALDERDIIEPVGSCCTLVAEVVLSVLENDELACKLLYETILIDTANFDPDAKKCTEKDKKIFQDLLSNITRLSKQKPDSAGDYNCILKAKTDLTNLTPTQIMRKDCKFLKGESMKVQISSIPVLAQAFLKLADAIDGLKRSAIDNASDVVILMGYAKDVDGSWRRDLVVSSASAHKAKQVSSILKENGQLMLTLIEEKTELDIVIISYNQGDPSLSRKFVLPYLAEHLDVQTRTPHEVDTSANVEIFIPIGEASSPRTFTGGSYPHHGASLGSINYLLGTGDPISHGGSNQSSAYNSCPYTPQNSCAENENGVYCSESHYLPSFTSREMIEKIERKRHKLRGYDRSDDELRPGGYTSYPFTPKNSYVDNNLENSMKGGVNSGFNPAIGINTDDLVKRLDEKEKIDGASQAIVIPGSSSHASKVIPEDIGGTGGESSSGY